MRKHQTGGSHRATISLLWILGHLCCWKFLRYTRSTHFPSTIAFQNSTKLSKISPLIMLELTRLCLCILFYPISLVDYTHPEISMAFNKYTLDEISSWKVPQPSKFGCDLQKRTMELVTTFSFVFLKSISQKFRNL